MATDEELRTIYNMFTDAWRLYKKYADVRPDDEYWEAVIDETNSLAKKHNYGRLCRDLIQAVIAELERKSKEIHKDAT